MNIWSIIKEIFGIGINEVERGTLESPQSKKKVWITNDTSSKLIPETELSSYISKGYRKGRGKIKNNQ